MYLLFAGLALAVLCWLLPTLLVKVVSSDVIDRDTLPALTLAVIDHRALAPLLALPTIALGAVLLFKVPWRWLWMTLGMLLMLPPAALMLYVFVAVMRGLYDPAPL